MSPWVRSRFEMSARKRHGNECSESVYRLADFVGNAAKFRFVSTISFEAHHHHRHYRQFVGIC